MGFDLLVSFYIDARGKPEILRSEAKGVPETEPSRQFRSRSRVTQKMSSNLSVKHSFKIISEQAMTSRV